MIAVGADPASVTNGKSALDYLASLQDGDGHYRYSSSSDQTPVWVTGQVLVAGRRRGLPGRRRAPGAEAGPDADHERRAGPAADACRRSRSPASTARPATPVPPPGGVSGGGRAARLARRRRWSRGSRRCPADRRAPGRSAAGGDRRRGRSGRRPGRSDARQPRSKRTPTSRPRPGSRSGSASASASLALARAAGCSAGATPGRQRHRPERRLCSSTWMSRPRSGRAAPTRPSPPSRWRGRRSTSCSSWRAGRPNHHLTAPWRFRVVGPAALERLKQAAGPEGAAKLARAPTLIVASAVLGGDPVQDEEDLHATAVASYIVLLAAHARGLAGYWRTPALLRERGGPGGGRAARRGALRRPPPPRPPAPGAGAAPSAPPAEQTTVYLDCEPRCRHAPTDADPRRRDRGDRRAALRGRRDRRRHHRRRRRPRRRLARLLGGAARARRLRDRHLEPLLEDDPRRPALPAEPRPRPGPRGAARAPADGPARPAPGLPDAVPDPLLRRASAATAKSAPGSTCTT